jgi:Family of unknown function (DUF6152)
VSGLSFLRAGRRTLLAWVVLAPGAAGAHHSALYDEQKVIELEGVIESVTWRNPHVRIALSVPGEDGVTTQWLLEGTSGNALERWGLTATDLPIGTRLRAQGPRSRLDGHAMIAAVVNVEGGGPVLLSPIVATRLALAETDVAGLFPPPARPVAPQAQANGLFRVWTPRRMSQTDPTSLPLTAAARRKLADYDPLTDDPALRCVPPGMPSMLDTSYPIEFVDRDDRILMRFEEWDGARTIYLAPGRGPAVQEPSPYGVSFGRWENESTTLAVFTLYIDYPYFDELGTPQSAAVTVLERYTPSSDGSRLDWQVTVTDATMFSTPIVRRGHMAWEPGETIKPFDCLVPADGA